jgi:uncharacterized protein DUF664
MPAQAPPVGDERSALHAYLVQQQDAFRAAVFGLTDAQAGLAASPPSTLTVGSLLKHVTRVQESWLALVLASPGLPEDDRTPAQKYADHQDGWTWHGDDTVAGALAAYDDVCGRLTSRRGPCGGCGSTGQGTASVPSEVRRISPSLMASASARSNRGCSQ